MTIELKKLPQSLYSQSTDSNIGKLWKIYSESLNEINELFEELLKLTDLDKVTGKQLDEIGRLIGEAREGRGDEEYKFFISIAILRNVSNGSIPTILGLSKLIPGASKGKMVEFLFQERSNVLNGLTVLSGILPLSVVNHNDGIILLDSSFLLASNDVLNPSVRRSASFSIQYTGSLQTFLIPKNFAKMIDQIRGAGIFGKIATILNTEIVQSYDLANQVEVEYSGESDNTPEMSNIINGEFIASTPDDLELIGNSLLDGSLFLAGSSGISLQYTLEILEEAA